MSYDTKRNDANQENNQDGTDDNRSWNCGSGSADDGPTADPGVAALRRRQQRNFLATLLVSRGVPMLLAGDERNRTQQGNNNAYCQDNPVSWLDWTASPSADNLSTVVRNLIALRASVNGRGRYYERHEHPGEQQPEHHQVGSAEPVGQAGEQRAERPESGPRSTLSARKNVKLMCRFTGSAWPPNCRRTAGSTA